MRVSSKLESGVIALIDIAMYSENGESVTAYSISERQNISVKYLEQILITLRQAKIIKSVKGAKGGYFLCKKPQDITLSEIINALDITVLNDFTETAGEDTPKVKKTLNSILWRDITAHLCKYCNNITLENLIEKCNNAILEESDSFMYYI